MHVVHGAHGDRVDRRAREPPPPAPSAGAGVAGRSTRPSSVLISVTASAPACCDGRGDLDDAVGVGAELGPARPAAAAVGRRSTSADSSGSWAKIAAASLEVRARQVDLDGDDVRRARRRAARRRGGSRRPSGPRCWPRRVAPVAASAGQVVAPASAATPGPCSPTALIIPTPVGCSRGAGLPAHSNAASDLTTMRAERRRGRGTTASSAPCPAVPDAVITGFGSSTDPTRVTSRRPATSLEQLTRAHGRCGDRQSRPVVLLQRAHRERRGRRARPCPAPRRARPRPS